jgi:hypothetical protein
MNMVAHEAVRVPLASRTREHAAEMEKIKRAIFVGNKTDAAVIGALDRMDSDSRKHDACAPRHAMSTDNAPVALTREKRGLSLILGSA